MKKLFIITGASRGLGASFVKLLVEKDSHFILIARNIEKLNSFRDNYSSQNIMIEPHSIDLSKPEFYDNINKIFKTLSWSKYSKVVLINNASTILPIKHLNKANINELKNIIQLNLLSCIAISQLFMDYCKVNSVKNSYILNISSGVSLAPVEGWGLYCISKAAINMLSAVIANDSTNWKYPIKSVAINPGPLDTSMQKMIRESDGSQSPAKDKFVTMYNDGALFNPVQVATKIINILSKDDFPNGAFINLNDFN